MKKLLLYCGLVLLILLLLALSISLFLVMSTGSRVARARDAITAAGDPLYLTDYAREPIPDEENAYYCLLQAKSDLEAFDKQFAALSEIDPSRRLRPDQVESLTKLVNDHTQYHRTYELLEKAAACTQYDDQLDYSQGLAVDLSHIMLFRSAARALQAKALVEAYRDEGDDGLAQCDQLLRITAHLQSQPTLVVHLVSIVCQSTAAQSANHVLRVAATTPAARERLDATLAALDNRRASVVAMQGERAMGVMTFAQLRSGKLDPATLDAPNSMRIISATWLGQAYLNDDEAKYIELMDLHIQAAELNAKERGDVLAPIDAELQAGGYRHMLTRLLVPALASALKASDRGDTLNHCLRVLLALESGKGPALGDLGLPDRATRDGAGLPLVARATDDGWLVYGVGENGVDDGGKFDWSTGELLDIGLAPLGESIVAEGNEEQTSEDSLNSLP